MQGMSTPTVKKRNYDLRHGFGEDYFPGRDFLSKHKTLQGMSTPTAKKYNCDLRYAS